MSLGPKFVEGGFAMTTTQRPYPGIGRILLLGTLLLLTVLPLAAQPPEWIWGSEPKDKETRYFRKTFTPPAGVDRISLLVTCDNGADLYLNGKRVLRNSDWSSPSRKVLTEGLVAGENTLLVSAKNSEGIAGLLVVAELRSGNSVKATLVSDASWQTAPNDHGDIGNVSLPTQGWVAATSLGAVGRQPWGEVLKSPVATAAESLQVAPGFKAELLRSAQPGEGSWVSMTIDPKGRLIVSPQGEEPLLRITLTASGQIEKIESIQLQNHGAIGMLYAFNSLYVKSQGKEGYHLYRLQDTNGDDTFDKLELIRRWQGGPGEHGAHGIVLGPDKMLYTVLGNFVDVPTDASPSSPHRNYADDLPLPRMEDGNGFGAGRKPPGGYVARVSPDGKQCDLFASGQRNTYDIAFNPEGELFGFDSDMEWDWGTPWYRPTRVYHIVSGGDQGFREGSAKWPEFYADSLPAAVNIGIGSPTGVRFGTGAKFPSKYQKALYVMDWSYGRILAVHLTPRGSSYAATFENFVKGKPLNVTDLEVGPDGALYFLTGGRGTQAGLYRVSYTGSESTAPVGKDPDAIAQDARAARHQLEAFHGSATPGAVDKVWAGLGSPDRWIRYAARIGLESQPVESWSTRALQETDATTGLHALLALARVGSSEVQLELLKTLSRWPLDSLSEELKLVKLRVIEVSFARHGLPDSELRKMAVEKLSKQFPSASWPLNRELSQLLIRLEAPGAISKVLAARDAATTQEEQLHYMVALRNAKTGWTLEDRERYFQWLNSASAPRRTEHPDYFVQWFHDVGSQPNNGASFDGFMRALRKEVIAGLSESERTSLASVLQGAPKVTKPAAPAVQRSFVKDWKMEDLAGSLDPVAHGRNYASGKAAFAAAQCLVCHRFGNEGGAVGPDITAVSSRFSRIDVLSSILEPSKVVSEQYENTTFVTRDDEEITGRVLEVNDQRLVVLTNPLNGTKTEIKKSTIKSQHKAKLSPMPEGLVNALKKEEILDLLAYIESMGNAQHAVFRRN